MSYQPKIAVYAIMKNEIANVDEWAETVESADHVTVLDTGSTDRSARAIEIALMNVGVKSLQVHTASINPWRFDVAHNTALALVPDWVDICIPLAADERMNRDWYDCIQDAIPPATWLHHEPSKRMAYIPPYKFTYRYEFAPGLSFTHDRIHSRNGFVWRYPFHEGVYPCSELPECRIHVPALKISQTQDKAVDRGKRDMVLAEMALKEFPNDPRMVFYAGRQFMYAGDIERAITTLERYSGLARQVRHVHPVEAGWVHQALADCYRKMGG